MWLALEPGPIRVFSPESCVGCPIHLQARGLMPTVTRGWWEWYKAFHDNQQGPPSNFLWAMIYLCLQIYLALNNDFINQLSLKSRTELQTYLCSRITPRVGVEVVGYMDNHNPMGRAECGPGWKVWKGKNPPIYTSSYKHPLAILTFEIMTIFCFNRRMKTKNHNSCFFGTRVKLCCLGSWVTQVQPSGSTQG